MASGGHYDLIVIGSGPGGATLAHRLAPTGKRILMLERGGYLPRSRTNWDAKAVFVDGLYQVDETWYGGDGTSFKPGLHYYVGGNSKVYGSALLRLRERDFGEVRHVDGISPAWPLPYDVFEPYYTEAERLYHVHGQRGEDPNEPWSSAPYAYPAIKHEPRIQQLNDTLVAEGLQPVSPATRHQARPEPGRLGHYPQPLHPLRRLRRLSLRDQRQGRRPGHLRGPDPRRPPQLHPAHRRDGDPARHRPRRPPGQHRARHPGGRARGVLGRYRGRRLRVAQLRAADAALGQRRPPERPGQRLGPGRPQLHAPQHVGGHGAVARAQPHRVPEDARDQRLLLRGAGL